MHKEKARALLKEALRADADFRDGQWEAIDLAANRRQRVLVVQRTGWGKSIVYFLAAKILRLDGAGPTLVISPLLALMRNQIQAAEKLGIRAMTLHSENLEEWPEVERALQSGQVDVLLISPERLGSPAFRQNILPLIRNGIGMFVVDEAHCISDWGHDFRPDYRRIVRLLHLLPLNVPVLCTTATANDRVVRDVESQIPNLHVVRGPLVRQSLKLFNIKLDDQASRLAWLAHFLPKLPGNGIIYTLTIQDARRVSEWLQQRGLNVFPYHADLDAAHRIQAEQQLLDNRVKALVATVALGMGFDKPDLGFVVHFQRPGSVVAYYQQVGRAGRAVDSAYGILLSGLEDDEIQDYFIRTAFPPAEVMEQVLEKLDGSFGRTLEELSAQLNYTRGTLEKALKLLEVDGAIVRDERKYSRSATAWEPSLMRAEQVTGHRRAELAQIKQYVEHSGCLMEFLARALDDPGAGPCGKCMNCSGRRERLSLPPELIQAATEFLRGDSLVLEPRRMWPKPALEDLEKRLPQVLERFETGRPKVTISERLRAREGRVLCLYGDAGWGEEVARGKYQTNRYSDALVKAAADLITVRWRPDPAPQWVTAIPSRRHTELVRDFAQRLASKLGLPFLTVLRPRRETRPQKEMLNSAMQSRNVLDAFSVCEPPADSATADWLRKINRLAARVAGAGGEIKLPAAPVLLVDDMVDSKWTITMAAVLLQHHGSGPVHPFALASSSLRGS
jgi:ATP-dependent DNA helicase RecQ